MSSPSLCTKSEADPNKLYPDRRAAAGVLDQAQHAGTDGARQLQRLCRQCGAIVTHRLDQKEAIRCKSGHPVAPTIARAALDVGARPRGSTSRIYEPPRPYSRREVNAHNAKYIARKKKEWKPAAAKDPAQNLSQNWKRAITAVRDFRALMSRNIRLPFHRTSFRPDPLTWSAINEIARREKVSVHELCAAIDIVKPRGVSRTAAIRVAVLRYFTDATAKAEQRPKPH